MSAAPVPTMPCASPAGPAGEHAWLALRPWWDVAFALDVAATACISALSVAAPWRLGVLGVLYAGVVAVYVSTRQRDRGSRQALLYIAMSAGLVVPAMFVYPGAGFLLFTFVPNIFALMELRPALVAATGLIIVSAASNLAYSGPTDGTIVSVAVFGVISFVFSFLMGGFIDRIIRQSVERAALIDQLTAAQAELGELSRQKGALDERQRLAREIHDAVAQNLSSVVMLVQGARAALERGDTRSVEHQLCLMETAAREGLGEARDLIGDLGPLALRSATLPDALGRVCEEMGPRFGFSARVHLEGDQRPLASAVEVLLLRAAQASLANVGQHARAARAVVRLSFLPASVRLEVQDDGIGFVPECSSGFGTAQQRARALELGGTCEVVSAPGAGTTVRVEVPA